MRLTLLQTYLFVVCQLMYAIVDIETTGSHPSENGITEIAIVLHNGTEIEGRFETLVNPVISIPYYVSKLTGITNHMVSTAPLFSAVAEQIFRLLENRIFVAHNVNFDFSFIKYHLQKENYYWTPRKLCTLKLSRKVFPGLHKYGLGHLCDVMDIPVNNRHRAGGDAAATTILFEKILETGGEKIIREFLKKDNHSQILPPNLPSEQVKALPYTPGVYYFHDDKGKVIYVGKAKVLRKRVLSHFTGLNLGKRRQDFLRLIHGVSFSECATELAAFVLESIEIKRLWPAFNYSQKHFEHRFGIYFFEDGLGYYRLGIDKKRKNTNPVASFHLLADAYRTLWKMVTTYQLEPCLCFLDKKSLDKAHYPDIKAHNTGVTNAIRAMQENERTYAIVDDADFGTDKCYFLVEKGKFYGMGTIAHNKFISDTASIKTHLTQYPENEVIHSLLKSYAHRFPLKVISLP